jgi:Icc-related predicted phosphoesterase
MDITCVSDLHGNFPQFEGGDLLIVAGDLTACDKLTEYLQFNDWLNEQKYKMAIVIAGNHDNKIQNSNLKWIPFRKELKPIIIRYLCDSSTEFEYKEPVRNPFDRNDKSFVYKKMLKIYGSPWTLRFPGENPHCLAFTCETEEELAEHWIKIPKGIDVLIVHSPPYGILDEVGGRNVGSVSLLKKIEENQIPLIIFGHVHENGGSITQLNLNTFVNASIVDERYNLTHKPVRLYCEKGKWKKI